MQSLISVLAGITAAIGWGIGDFFAAKASKQQGPYRAAFLTVATGTLIIAAIYIALFPDFTIAGGKLAALTAISAILILAQIAFFKALEIGPVGIAATIGAAYPIVTVPLAILVFGEKITTLQFFAILTIILGIFLTSIQREKRLIKVKGIVFAGLSMLCWGVGFAFLDRAMEGLDWKQVAFYQYVTMFLWQQILFRFFLGQTNRTFLGARPSISTTAAATLFLVGNAAFYIGLGTGLAAVVTPLSSAYPAITVVMAMIFMKERLQASQLFGIAVVVGGVILLAIL